MVYVGLDEMESMDGATPLGAVSMVEVKGSTSAQGDPAVMQKFFIMFWAQVHCCPSILHPMLTKL